MPLTDRFHTLLRPDLETTLRRFPVPLAAALIATIVHLLGREGFIGSEFHDRMFIGATTAFTIGVASRIWLESQDRPAVIILGQVIAALLGIAAALAMFNIWFTPALLITALVLMVGVAPGLPPGGTPARFWIFNIRSALMAMIGAVGAFVFLLGFWAILTTLMALFGVKLSFRLIFYPATFAFVFVLPLYWLSYQPVVREIDNEEPPSDVLMRAIAGLTDFIFIPLLISYGAIFHLYAARIAIDAALPHGLIGRMVSIFLVLGYLTFLLSFPQRSPWPESRRLFCRIWPPATVVPAGLLALALWERIDAYGVTESRYFIAVLALSSVLLFLVWLPKQRLDLRIIPIVAAMLLLVGAVGPFAARQLTAHSQAQQLLGRLENAGALKDGHLTGEQPASWNSKTRRGLESIIDLLADRRALYLVAAQVGEDLANNPKELSARLGLIPSRQVTSEISVSYVRINSDILTNEFTCQAPCTQQIVFRVPDGPEFKLREEGRYTILSGPDQVFTFDLSKEPGSISDPDSMSNERVFKANRSQAALIVRTFYREGSGKIRDIDRISRQFLLRDYFGSAR